MIETTAASDATGVFAEQGTDFIFLCGDSPLGNRNGDLSLRQQCFSLADLQIRPDSTLPAAHHQIERGLAALRSGARNRQALVEILEVDVGTRHRCDQRGLHAVALVLRL